MFGERDSGSATGFLLQSTGVRARLLILACALLGGALPGRAQVPELTVFIYADSLTCDLDGSQLFTEERIARLADGYPLSFTLQITLRRDRTLQLDPDVAVAQARLRITRPKWDARTTLELNDFNGRTFRGSYASLADLQLELDDRLYVALADVRRLRQSDIYYGVLEVAYQTLTFDDVRSAEAWLRGDGAEPDSLAAAPRSAGEVALGYLWDLAGMRAQKERFRTGAFRLRDLRTIE